MATPLGNVADASARLVTTLTALTADDIVAAEDTRRLRRLCADLSIDLAARVVTFHDVNERARVASLVEACRDGATVAVLTDAGMPSISDPGYRLVAAAIEAELDISVVPGPSAVTTAVAISGLPADRFCFEGFPPRRSGQRRRFFAELAEESRTIVLFEAPHRIAACLADLAAAFGGERRAVVCRELTKTYEEIRRGTLAELSEWATGNVRGELTLVVAGRPAPDVREPDAALLGQLAAAVAALQDDGVERRAALTEVARRHGVPRRVVYDAVLAHRRV